MDKFAFERQYNELAKKYEKDLNQLYQTYIYSRFGLKINDFIKVSDKDKVSYFHIDDFEFRGPNFSIQGRSLSSPYFRFKLTPVDEYGNILWISTGAMIYEDYTNVSKVNLSFSGKKIDCFGNILSL